MTGFAAGFTPNKLPGAFFAFMGLRGSGAGVAATAPMKVPEIPGLIEHSSVYGPCVKPGPANAWISSTFPFGAHSLIGCMAQSILEAVAHDPGHPG